MEQVQVIRFKVRVEGQSIRQVSREMGISRNTVKKYLYQSEPKRLVSQPRGRPVLENVRQRIEELLEEWKDRTSAKQRVIPFHSKSRL